MSNIIFLLGVSSSGKSTIAKEIQKQASEKYVIVGFDHAVESLDKKYWPGGSHEKEGFYYEQVKTEKGEYPDLRHGAVGEKFLRDMLDDIIAQVNSGKNLIIDYVMSDEEHLVLLTECKDSNIIQVGIKPPLNEVIRREKARGDRKEGIAEAAYESFYQNKHFDLLFDDKDFKASNAAKKILVTLHQPND